MEINFVTIFDDQSDSLTKRGANRRMLSFFYVQQKRPGFLKDYVLRGHGRDVEKEAIKKMSVREFIREVKLFTIEKEEIR